MNYSISRNELYNLVWSKPMTKLTEQLAINATVLRSACLKAKIPLPQAGYWEKLKAGKAVNKPPLPKWIGDEVIVLKSINNYRSTLESEITMTLGSGFVLTERLTKPYECIKLAKQNSEEKNKHKILDRGLIHNSVGVHISTQPSNLRRGLKILNKLIELMLLRGHQVLHKEHLKFNVNGIEFKISMREKLKREEIENPKYSWDKFQYKPTDILMLIADVDISHSYSWKDGKISLEKQFAKIIAGLELASQEVIKYNNELEMIWAQQREEIRKREEAQLLIDSEKNAFNKLLSDLERWKLSEAIREYAEFMEHNLLKEDKMSQSQKEYILWARKKAEWVDPVICLTDPILGKY